MWHWGVRGLIILLASILTFIVVGIDLSDMVSIMIILGYFEFRKQK